MGGRYEVRITETVDTVWTGPLGIGAIGDVRVIVPKASSGDRLWVRVTAVEVDPWTKRREARYELEPLESSPDPPGDEASPPAV